ncbi:MAG: Nif3-like dinuclear metal center hexameric protein [Pirellulaceae bacterium]|jgi:dinuclear metal center YbgI/SA1388 family protein|nr:Nif3-like dinuclear metal center hexameric protein [Pirellulaceae bacterium]
MISIADICRFLEEFAPRGLAADWDNVGLLVGDRQEGASRVMTCLTITPAVAAEAIRERVELIVAHHPLPFRPLSRLTTDEPTGKILWQLIRAGVAVYSPHTSFDSAADGINQQLAAGLELVEIEPLTPVAGFDSPQGIGRRGRLTTPRSLSAIAEQLKTQWSLDGLFLTGDVTRSISRVAIACGSAGDLLSAAIDAGSELFITGEARLHTAYEAEARGIALLLVGHYASERPGVERLSAVLAQQFPTLAVWASRDERDPLVWV